MCGAFRRSSRKEWSIAPTRTRRGGAATRSSATTAARRSQSRAAPSSPGPLPVAVVRADERGSAGGDWRRIDLHLHTPASVDYQQPRATYLDLLRRAEERELDVVAFTDHNSVRGYAEMWREIEDLELLEYLKRLELPEEERLREYRRLLAKVLVLPGFEFTAEFGFHILAIFPEGTSVRLMEHLLLALGVPEDRFGSGEVGATSPVLRAYELLASKGALVIGAHVNSTHGVAMQGLRFGGQTKIAYTQDPNLHALEVTDLVLGQHRRSTARFFNGSKPEYSRRMHCIQGSDAHRLERDPDRETNLGIGDRATEVFLPQVSFAALKALFASDAFDHVRPYVPQPDDPVKAARLIGNTDAQAFHESVASKRIGAGQVIRDAAAMANGEGGTIFVGASAAERRPVAGLADAAAVEAELRREIAAQVAPNLLVAFEALESDGKAVLVVTVPRGAERPYAIAGGVIPLRKDGETVPASRDEIVALVREVALGAALPTGVPALPSSTPVDPSGNGASPVPLPVPPPAPATVDRPATATATATALETPSAPVPTPASTRSSGRRGRTTRAVAVGEAAPPVNGRSPAAAPVVVGERLSEVEEPIGADPVAPTTGVEVVESFEQDGVTYYTLRDLRSQTLVHNVTADTKRSLWRAAIAGREEGDPGVDQIRWSGDYGVARRFRMRSGDRRYNLVYRGDGLRTFYGVSEAGMSGGWRALVADAGSESGAPTAATVGAGKR